MPFYSYRTKNWKGEPDNEAYLLLLLPWRREEKPTGENVPYLYTNTYYQIPIAQDRTAPEYRLKSNRYYRQEVKVSILGSFSIEDLVTLTPNTFIVLDWGQSTTGDPTESDVKMSHTSFLAVGHNQVEMNNIPSASVEYSSSHEVTAEFIRLEYYSYYDDYVSQTTNKSDRMRKIVYEKQPNGTWNRTVTNESDGGTISGNNYTRTNVANPFTSTGSYGGYPFGGFGLTTTEGKITFTHNIPATQYVEAKITVAVSNEAIDTPEEIVFTQRPAIYITGQVSMDKVIVRGIAAAGTGTGYQNVYTASGNQSIGAVQARGGITGKLSGNDNRHQYTLHISSLSDNDNYIIGDPREEMTLTLLTAPNNGLHYNGAKYYGASKTVDPKMIAPAFMVASSYGKTTVVTYENAIRRCASYQENGYPAGRWRLPTEGEIQFVIDKSADEVIPELFNGTYWASSQRYYSSANKRFTNGNNTATTYVRCVYDIWFWGDAHTAGDTFTWGNR